ncbi:hypothetical protein BC829DRAFT_470404 [Chytridium lagenaria]|nr:hypothetical protein BC829DRAFT_470404 [Chytridium lagenaria]
MESRNTWNWRFSIFVSKEARFQAVFLNDLERVEVMLSDDERADGLTALAEVLIEAAVSEESEKNVEPRALQTKDTETRSVETRDVEPEVQGYKNFENLLSSVEKIPTVEQFNAGFNKDALHSNTAVENNERVIEYVDTIALYFSTEDRFQSVLRSDVERLEESLSASERAGGLAAIAEVLAGIDTHEPEIVEISHDYEHDGDFEGFHGDDDAAAVEATAGDFITPSEEIVDAVIEDVPALGEETVDAPAEDVTAPEELVDAAIENETTPVEDSVNIPAEDVTSPNEEVADAVIEHETALVEESVVVPAEDETHIVDTAVGNEPGSGEEVVDAPAEDVTRWMSILWMLQPKMKRDSVRTAEMAGKNHHAERATYEGGRFKNFENFIHFQGPMPSPDEFDTIANKHKLFASPALKNSQVDEYIRLAFSFFTMKDEWEQATIRSHVNWAEKELDEKQIAAGLKAMAEVLLEPAGDGKDLGDDGHAGESFGRFKNFEEFRSSITTPPAASVLNSKANKSKLLSNPAISENERIKAYVTTAYLYFRTNEANYEATMRNGVERLEAHLSEYERGWDLRLLQRFLIALEVEVNVDPLV